MYGTKKELSETVNKGIFASIKRWFLKHPGDGFDELMDYILKHSKTMFNWVIEDPHIALLSVWMDYKGILPFFTSDEKENAMDCILEYYPKYFQMDWSIMLPIGTLDDPEGRIGKGISRTDARKAIRGQNTNNDRRPIPCICVDAGKEYRSFTQAAKDIGANSRQIMDCCYGVRNDIKGYRFKLKEGE